MNFFGLNWDTISGLLRNILLALGAGLVASGKLDASDLNTIVGSIIALLGVGLSWFSSGKKAEAKAIAKAVEASPLVDAVPNPFTKKVDIVLIPKSPVR
jgi:hypothetical protein